MHSRFRSGKRLFQAAAIVLLVAWVYSPTSNGDWIRDDVVEIVNNPVLRVSPSEIWRIWFAPISPDYFPLKATVQWLEWHTWGLDRFGYHAVNVLLHLLSALLFWRLLASIFAIAKQGNSNAPSAQIATEGISAGDTAAWLGAVLYSIHPTAVETVAWISELKNCLSVPPLLLAMQSWVDADSKSSKGEANLYPFAAVLWFLVAMLCKTSVVMFPLVLLLYAWWRRGNIAWRDLFRTLPFFAISLGLGLVTLAFQQHRAIGGFDLGLGGPASRLVAAGLSLVFYFGKFVCPMYLLPVYPRWEIVPPMWVQFLPWAVLASIGAWLWPASNPTSWRRHVVFGLGFFTLMLLPVIGFVPMSYFRTAWVGDHLAYLPQAGLIGLAGAGFGRVLARWRIAWLPVLFLLGALAVGGRNYARVYCNEETLWNYTLRFFPGSWIAHNDLGIVLTGAGRPQEALVHYREAWLLKPTSAEVNYDYANALVAAGKAAEAIDRYEQALRLNPEYIEARVNLGNTRLSMGQPREAVRQLRVALAENDSIPETHYDLANALAAVGDNAEAIAEYEEALRLRPDYFSAEYHVANVLGNSGRVAEALRHYEAAVRLNPRSSEAFADLGLALANLDDPEKAIAPLNEALRLNPKSAEARAYLGFAMSKSGRLAEAVAQYEKAVSLAPNWGDAHYQLATALRALGREAEAKQEFTIASRLGAAP